MKGMDREIEIRHEPKNGVCAIRLYYRGEHVSGLWIHRLSAHFGQSVTLRMGGIGGVGTKEEYRMRGFARRVMEYSNRYMLEAGFDIAALFGIRNFYERWGYAPALPEHRLYLNVENLSSARLNHSIFPFSDEHREDVIRIYELNNEERCCSVVRKPDSWMWFTKGTRFGVKADPMVLLDGSGRLCGYISFDDTEDYTAVAEVGYSDPSVFESIAAAIRDRARERGHEEAWLAIPPDHPFSIFLRRFGCRITSSFNRSGGGMMRIINLETTFRKLAPELERRIKRSGMRGWEEDFLLRTDIGSLRFRISKEAVHLEPREKVKDKLVEIPQSKLIQLLVGYRTIDDLTLEKGVHVTPSLIPGLRLLFPLMNPYIWWSDRF
ncbi:TPA: GNAT family N-acetyltransferase [Candidatus Poribacteria bacterium]|nr:GNAT family N-acetyltransferase [Candidatus Poribacteria bacterium]HEX29782.1 GNAT family N-acetyltransferase [Candidatus Poribacteria bacterium]